MERHEESLKVIRIRKVYTKAFKLQVVQEIEQGTTSIYEVCLKYGIQSSSTVYGWLRQFGHFNWDNQTPLNMAKAIEQKYWNLKQKLSC